VANRLVLIRCREARLVFQQYRARVGNSDAFGCRSCVGTVVAICEGGGGEEFVNAGLSNYLGGAVG
jgi:hypothetical protein